MVLEVEKSKEVEVEVAGEAVRGERWTTSRSRETRDALAAGMIAHGYEADTIRKEGMTWPFAGSSPVAVQWVLWSKGA
jgi:hypothetical protein